MVRNAVKDFVRRTCTDVTAGLPKAGPEPKSLPIEHFGDTSAYVLLGAPGSGKTTEFQRQARESGGHPVTARDFLAFDDKAEWRGVTLFIDGLDEVRAGCADGRTPLDAIRAKLARLGCPKFRLSCREADWFGSSDRHYLKGVSPDRHVHVLHIDPLSQEDSEEILKHGFGMKEPEAFIGSARERGIDGMLVNPQALEMLALAVQEHDWPSTRTETFELACRKLLSEQNSEHRIAEQEAPDINELMRAAGKLFAFQLLTGTAGYARLHGESTRDILALEDVPDANRNILRRALRTNLFGTPDGERALPFHRQIAEFLAARFLSNLIADGLPLSRTIALMTGHDGVVVTDLRGLCAWLAAKSHSSREDIIARDPLGPVLYGDAQGFSSDEKRLILNHLEETANENPWFVRAIHIDSRLGDLVHEGMEEVFQDRTMDSRRDDKRQSYVYLMVEILAQGRPVKRAADHLLDIIRDETWWPRIRHAAIEAYERQRGNHAQALAGLKALAQDVYAGEVVDPDDDLLGSLLVSLYPEGLSESEVVGYLRAPKRASQLLSYEYFWQRRVARRSNCGQMARLLDQLVEERDRLYAETRAHGRRANALRRVPSSILERYLSMCQDDPDPPRLFDWLGVAGWVGDWNYDTRLGSQARHAIRIWIGERPELWKVLMDLGLKHSIISLHASSQYSFNQLMWMERKRRLFDSHPPPDFAYWCLSQAVVTESRPAAVWLMHRVAEAIHESNGREISRKEVDARIAENDLLQREYKKRLDALRKNEENERGAQEKPVRRLSERQTEWQAIVKDSQIALRDNRANPRLLHELAKGYLGGFGNVAGDTPRERLSDLLGGDEALVETALAGIRGTVSREELPSVAEVIHLGVQQRMHYLSFPFLAGLDQIYREVPMERVRLDSSLARLALTMHYNVPVWPRSWETADRKPRWFPALLNERPELVAGILVRTARSQLRGRRNFSQHLYDLAHSADHQEVARLVALPILSSFPVRCAEQQLSTLRHTLVAACLYCERESLVGLIEKKLASRSMNVAQRVYWLATGLIIRSAPFLKRLESFVAGSQQRARRLSQFFASRFDTPRALIQLLDVAALSLLIRIIGAIHRPYSLKTDSEEGAIVTPGIEAADRVRGLLNLLASNASIEASEHLRRLSAQDELVAWRAHLGDAKSRQNAIRRDASFVYASVRQVADMLKNRHPANAADLAALTLDQLKQIARRIRRGNTDAWRKFWNVDSYNRPLRPRPENACRDILLDELRSKLEPLEIEAQPEGSYADDKRADIRVSYGGFNVPIEIKRSCHPNLWSAVRSQLIAKYTRDPGADGHGIYVVFWFGDTEHCRPTPGAGGIPTSATDLKTRLVDGLSAVVRRKIAVCLIDVAKTDNSRMLSDGGI